MPRVSLTDLVDIVSRSGTPKATKVANVKARPDYEPAFDFYRPLREGLIAIHEGGQPRRAVDTILERATDLKKLRNYPALVFGYKKWWGRKVLEWFSPPRAIYSRHGVEVIINPELGLRINGTPHLVKLYFKPDPLAKLKIDIVTYLMESSLRPLCHNDEKMSILDVRRARLFSHDPAQDLGGVVDAELAYISALWDSM